ncbi:hypothetical protein D3C87_1700040 [compost metagenome]
MIHSRVSWMFLPVDKSMMVSAPQRQAHTAFSTSSSMLDDTAEFPILALIFTRKFRPMIIGSLSGWLMFEGITALPAATSSLTNSAVMWLLGVFAPKLWPACWCAKAPALPFKDAKCKSIRWFSRMAMYSISGVIMPFLA